MQILGTPELLLAFIRACITGIGAHDHSSTPTDVISLLLSSQDASAFYVRTFQSKLAQELGV